MALNKNKLQRQTNYIIVNSQSKKAYADTVKMLELAAKEDPDLRIIFALRESLPLPSVFFRKYNLHTKRGQLFALAFNEYTPETVFDEVVLGMKYGILVTDTLTAENYKLMLSDSFKAKSIDVVKHQSGLLISENEIKLLKRSVSEAKENKFISRNFSYCIYPDESFEFTKETFIKIKKQHETIDAFGIMLAQYTVNVESAAVKKDTYSVTAGDLSLLSESIKDLIEKYVFYGYFTRKISGASEKIIKEGTAFLSETLGFNKKQKNVLFKIFCSIEYPENKDEQQDNKEQQSNIISEEQKLKDAVTYTVNKIYNGEIIISNEEQAFNLADTVIKEKQLSVDTRIFTELMSNEIQKRLTKK